MNVQTAATNFAPITRRQRIRTDGQEQRMVRREVERARNDGRKMHRAAKRSQAYA